MAVHCYYLSSSWVGWTLDGSRVRAAHALARHRSARGWGRLTWVTSCKVSRSGMKIRYHFSRNGNALHGRHRVAGGAGVGQCDMVAEILATEGEKTRGRPLGERAGPDASPGWGGLLPAPLPAVSISEGVRGQFGKAGGARDKADGTASS